MKTQLVSNHVSELANKKFKIHKFKKEWFFAILAVGFAKLFTNVVSIYAGYHYLFSFLTQLIPNVIIRICLIFITLILLEFLTFTFLEKCFKFIIRRTPTTAIITGVVSIILFSISFYISTNGLALQQQTAVDNSININEQFESKKKIIENKYNLQVNENKKFITLIQQNPDGWSNHVRCIVTATQLNQIDSIYKNIANLKIMEKREINQAKKEKQNYLSENTEQTTNEAKKFFVFVAIIMAVQILSNFGLMFFYSKIYKDEKKEQYLNETVNEVSGNIENNVIELLNNKISTILNFLTNSISRKLQDTDMIEDKKEQKKITITKKKNTKKNHHVTGFSNQYKSQIKNQEKNNSNSSKTSIRINEREKLKDKNKLNLNYLKKHKNLTLFILNNIPEDLINLSNQNIREIDTGTRRAKYKSKTTIIKIYDIMKSLGYENINFDN